MRVENSQLTEQYIQNSQVTNTKGDIKNDKEMKEIPVINSISQENQSVKEEEVIEAIEKANKQFKTFDRRLEFSIHEKTKQIIVKVIDTDDDTVLREIPSEKILDMVAKMWELSGIFVDEKR